MDNFISINPVQLEHHLLLQSILDSLPENICVLDSKGTIIYANRSWYSFAENNGGAEPLIGIGINYLDVTETSAQHGDTVSAEASSGIKKVLDGRLPEFYLEYPCDSPTEERWFMLQVKALNPQGLEYFVISHHDITMRKRSEREVEALTLIDPLTGIANRRHFFDYALSEWKRCQREHSPFCIALVDCDDFKAINDAFGHHGGDIVLKTVASTLNKLARRPSDLVCRFGGDEFILAFSGTTSKHVTELLTKGLVKLKNSMKNTPYHITLSVGVAEAIPNNDVDINSLIQSADTAMYQAKKAGKNKIVIGINHSKPVL